MIVPRTLRRVLFLALLTITFSGAAHAYTGNVRIHYHRFDSNYSGWALYTWGASTAGNTWCGTNTEQPQTGTDSFGTYFDVPVNTDANGTALNFIINNCANGQIKDPGPNQTVDASQYQEAWVISGDTTVYTSQPTVPEPTTVRIHYYRPDKNYTGWALYTWNDSTENNSWCSSEVQQTGTDSYGVYFDVTVDNSTGTPVGDLGFIINNCADGQIKDPGPDQHLNTLQYSAAWVISGDSTVYTTQPNPTQLLNAVFNKQQAYWMDRSRIAVQSGYLQSGYTYSLAWSTTGGMQLTNTGITGATGTIALQAAGALTAEELARYPQLSTYSVLTVDPSIPLSTIQQALTGQVAIQSLDGTGTIQYATGLQTAPVLDDIYYYPGKLGVVWAGDPQWNDFPDENSGVVKLKVWAPTAQAVSVLVFQHETDTTPIGTAALKNHDGVWAATSDQNLRGYYYQLQVQVYVPVDGKVDTNITTDPYSLDISTNGTMSRFTDLDSAATKPTGWDSSTSPTLNSLNDLSIYELHVRDFSIGDSTVPADHQGTYDAFADMNSNGMKHLESLAQSGLKAVHLLPTFHFASINEDKTTWQTPTGLTGNPPDSQAQQAAVAAVQSTDAYNWGYDPVHYMAPEGAYAMSNSTRVLEYRTMVMGLHQAGLRVIQDVVFNHTNASGEATNSNLDEIVPLYYHRLDANGSLLTGSCCPDTASEHQMMEKLMIDTLVLNALKYKVDGFRFDIMSFHFTYNMADIKAALNALTPENSGIDGSKIYLYGEGFNFGDTVNNAIGPNADQVNLYGYGVGSFNDRIRDGIRGGSPFTDERVQGYATGLYTDSSDYTNGAQQTSDQLTNLLQETDWIRVGLAGNLRDYSFVTYTGDVASGSQINYNGQPTGYTATPIEAVNYCSVHDNQDLFDAVQLKANLADNRIVRARRAGIAMSLIELGQAIPFFQGGDDLLRSKDMDQNSYDSGDWFNKIDWSGFGNNWGIGLPIASQNQSQWPLMQPLLADADYTMQPNEIRTVSAVFQEFMKIRYSSGLFRMTGEQEIQNNLTFLNTGTNQVPGVIVERLDANGGSYGQWNHVLVVWNATTKQQQFSDPSLTGMAYTLHPVQQKSADPTTRLSSFNSRTGTATVPAMSVAVYVSQ